MKIDANQSIKDNVHRFNDDITTTGSYKYTANKLSSQIASSRISECIAACYDFSGKTILDIGCGDGAYTLEFPALGASAVLGVDPAEVAIQTATNNAKKNGLDKIVCFEVGNIFDFKTQNPSRHFDCVVIRGVLHHLSDPQKAIESISTVADTIIILEPNGLNPVLKLIERLSSYHRLHEERSFFPSTIKRWCTSAGLNVTTSQQLNLVPFFCPDWLKYAQLSNRP